MRAIVYLEFREMMGGRRAWFLAFLLVLPVLLTWLVTTAGNLHQSKDPLPPAMYLFVLYPVVICGFLALLYGSALWGTELERKTLTYLTTRPIAKWQILFCKYLTVVVVLIPLVSVSVLVSWWMLNQPSGGKGMAALFYSVFWAILGYTGIFMLIGVIAPRRAMVVGLMYTMIVEIALSFLPVVISQITTTHYIRSLAVRTSGVPIPADTKIFFESSPYVCVGVLSGIVVGTILISSVIASSREYLATEGA